MQDARARPSQRRSSERQAPTVALGRRATASVSADRDTPLPVSASTGGQASTRHAVPTFASSPATVASRTSTNASAVRRDTSTGPAPSAGIRPHRAPMRTAPCPRRRAQQSRFGRRSRDEPTPGTNSRSRLRAASKTRGRPVQPPQRGRGGHVDSRCGSSGSQVRTGARSSPRSVACVRLPAGDAQSKRWRGRSGHAGDGRAPSRRRLRRAGPCSSFHARDALR